MQKIWPTIGGLTVQPPKNEKSEVELPMVMFTGEPVKNNFEVNKLLNPQGDNNDNTI
jgi:hypothetical protein